MSTSGLRRTLMLRYRMGGSALCAAPLHPGRCLRVGSLRHALEKSRLTEALGLEGVWSITLTISGRQGGSYGVSHVAFFAVHRCDLLAEKCKCIGLIRMPTPAGQAFLQRISRGLPPMGYVVWPDENTIRDVRPPIGE